MNEAQVRAQLSGVTYSDAIMYYSMQKQDFINSYVQAIGGQSQALARSYIADFFDAVNNDNFQGQAFGLANNLAERLEAAVIKAMDGQDLSQFSNLIQETDKKYGELSEKARNQLQQTLFEFFDLNIMHQELEKTLITIKDYNGGINTQDMLTWAKSYVSSKFYNKLLGQEKTYGRRTVLAGYFEEALVHNATNKLTKHLKNSLGSFQTGSKRIVSNRGSIETVFDEYFNFFSKDLSKDFEGSVLIDENRLLAGYGAQIKLWNPPWSIKKPRKSYPIFSNANLFATWGSQRSWIKGVLYLQNKVPQTLGDNVMYILGNSIYWTCDLIQKFREDSYYLAFHHDGQKFTQTIAWETIDMSKPYKI